MKKLLSVSLLLLFTCSVLASDKPDITLKELKKDAIKYVKHKGNDVERMIVFKQMSERLKGKVFSGEMKVKSIKADRKTGEVTVRFEYEITSKGVYIRGKKQTIKHKIIVLRKGRPESVYRVKEGKKEKVTITIDNVRNSGYRIGRSIFADIRLECHLTK